MLSMLVLKGSLNVNPWDVTLQSILTDLLTQGMWGPAPSQSNLFWLHVVFGKIMPNNRLAPPSLVGTTLWLAPPAENIESATGQYREKVLSSQLQCKIFETFLELNDSNSQQICWTVCNQTHPHLFIRDCLRGSTTAQLKLVVGIETVKYSKSSSSDKSRRKLWWPS